MPAFSRQWCSFWSKQPSAPIAVPSSTVEVIAEFVFWTFPFPQVIVQPPRLVQSFARRPDFALPRLGKSSSDWSALWPRHGVDSSQLLLRALLTLLIFQVSRHHMMSLIAVRCCGRWCTLQHAVSPSLTLNSPYFTLLASLLMALASLHLLISEMRDHSVLFH